MSRLSELYHFHAEKLGLPLVIAGLIVLFVLIWLAFAPMGPSTTTEGRVIAIGPLQSEQGSRSTASVKVDGQVVRIIAPFRHGCRVGDIIQLDRKPTRWGARYSPSGPSPCQPPFRN